MTWKLRFRAPLGFDVPDLEGAPADRPVGPDIDPEMFKDGAAKLPRTESQAEGDCQVASLGVTGQVSPRPFL
jgi:hypothetical protein